MNKPMKKDLQKHLLVLSGHAHAEGDQIDCPECLAIRRALIEKYGDGGPKMTMKEVKQILLDVRTYGGIGMFYMWLINHGVQVEGTDEKKDMQDV